MAYHGYNVRYFFVPFASILFLVFVPLMVFSSASKTCNMWVKWYKHPTPCDRPLNDKKRPDAYTLTTPMQHPYAVLVYSRDGEGYSTCSGTLLTDSWVLTAGHCHTSGKLFVYGGGKSLKEVVGRTDYPEEAQLRGVSKICKHEVFDVALLKVVTRFTLSKYLNTISLPTGLLPEKETACNFTAFGRLQMTGEDEMDSIRKTQEVKVVYPCECFYREYKGQYNWEKAGSGKNFICSVPREDYGVCRGDSGSGLVCGGVLHGVTMSIVPSESLQCNSMTRDVTCGSKNTTSIFLSVFPVLMWINKHVVNQDTEGCQNSAKTVNSMIPLVLGLFFVIRSYH